MNICGAVFEGGGVRGIGLVGAASVFEKEGYKFCALAGSSAGAIVAALLAAGFSCGEIETEIKKLDYTKFKEENTLDKIGVVGKYINIESSFGIYSADYFESWLSSMLAKKSCAAFGDLRIKLQVTASDISDKKLLILPEDLEHFGINPKTFSLAKAVRMSMSIPIFYKPSILKDQTGREHHIVDGGLYSNYPINILDGGGLLKNPVFGIRFLRAPSAVANKKGNLLDYLKDVVASVVEAHDIGCLENIKGDTERTVFIPTTVLSAGAERHIGATDFDITREEADKLFENGVAAAREFLHGWSFEAWKKQFRG
jgi:NTE family protein